VSKPIKLLTVIGFILLLTGCSLFAGRQQTEAPMDSNHRQQQLQTMENFTLQASLGIRTPDDSISGSLRWQQQQQSYQANLNNFIGVSLFELNQSPSGSNILINGERYYDTDATSLLLQLSGWSMPLADMPLWLRGLPGKNSTDIRYDEHGRVTGFILTDSNGVRWQLQYQSFFGDALSLPKNLQLQSDDTRIKLVIRNWQY